MYIQFCDKCGKAYIADQEYFEGVTIYHEIGKIEHLCFTCIKECAKNSETYKQLVKIIEGRCQHGKN